jgi:V8-like Glu-specific endopeptidase
MSCVGFCCACSEVSNESADAPLGCSAASIVYGADDRKEPWQMQAPWQALAKGASIAIVESRLARNLELGSFQVADLTAQSLLQLCADERFADQPSLASCSGVLLAEDLVLTAGHCIKSAESCHEFVYVADFINEKDGPWRGLESRHVRGCQRLEWLDSDNGAAGTVRDIALIRLDGTYDHAAPALAIRRDVPRVGESVVAMGHPAGVPLKIDDGGTIQASADRPEGYALADTDSFAGSSGGPVFDARGALLAILLGGGRDYAYDTSAGCFRTRRGDAASCETSSERIAPIGTVLYDLCSRGVTESCALLE